jgi:hypothetical protein
MDLRRAEKVHNIFGKKQKYFAKQAKKKVIVSLFQGLSYI